MSSFPVKPQASYTEVLYQIYPIDKWSRTEIVNYCFEKKLKFAEIATTMGTTSLQFSAEDYYKVKYFIDRYHLI